jgi:2-methylcitrate dehydratase PrpD
MTASTTDLDRAVHTVAALDLSAVPEQTVRHAEHVIADTIAVVLAGARSAEIVRLVELDAAEGLVTPLSEAAQGQSSTVLSAPAKRAHPAYAAFLNATAGTTLELDEGMRPTGHPAMHVIPAALAVAERARASGADLLRAVLAGYEVSGRLFRAYRLRPDVHPHGHIGAVGAAVAVALLEGTDPVATARVAATRPLLAVWQACYEGATVRNTYTGYAAQSGVRASALVRAGFTGAAEALDVALGHVAGELVDAAALTEPLRLGDLGISRNYFKIHSACALTHCAVEAALAVRRYAPGTIQRVQVETVAVNLKINRQPAPNALSGRFSLPYAVATALLLGRSDIDAFRYRPEVAVLAEKVEVSVDPKLDAQWPDAAPARVSVVTTEGTRTVEITNPRGHHSRPLAEKELGEKFRTLVGDDQAAVWWHRLTNLREVADCSALFTDTR